MVESEKTAKWQYTRHCEELGTEIKKLREEVGLDLLIYFYIDIIIITYNYIYRDQEAQRKSGTCFADIWNYSYFHKLISSQCSWCKTFQLFTLKKEWRLLPQQQLSTQWVWEALKTDFWKYLGFCPIQKCCMLSSLWTNWPWTKEKDWL